MIVLQMLIMQAAIEELLSIPEQNYMQFPARV